MSAASNTVLYTKRIRGCNECPSCFIHDFDLRKDKCLRKKKSNGRFVTENRIPRWCPLINRRTK